MKDLPSVLKDLAQYIIEVTNASIQKENPNPSQETNKPSAVPEVPRPSVLKDIIEPFILKEIIEPSIRKKIITPSVLKENNESSVVEDINGPSLLEQITNPGILEEIIEPITPDNALQPPPPFISYVTFNRLGLTMRNLNNILDSDEDFEMHIIDCNSKDDTWEYIKSLKDKRIKSRTRFKINRGPIYVLNYNLLKRKPNQYFFTIDSDVYIKTKNWLTEYMEVFKAFPEVGLLGIMRDDPYPRFLPPIIPKINGDRSYLQLKNAEVDVIMDFIPGCLQGLRPELINEIGYWSEECGYGDAELSPRIMHYTSFKTGFITSVEVDMTQFLGCDKCLAKKFCKLNRSVKTCFMLSRQSNKNESFAKKFKWKYLDVFRELAEGQRTAYCASILDPKSLEKHVYHTQWALENFEHYIRKSN